MNKAFLHHFEEKKDAQYVIFKLWTPNREQTSIRVLQRRSVDYVEAKFEAAIKFSFFYILQ